MKKLMVILVVLMTSATAWGQSNPWKPVKDGYIMNEMEQSLADSMADDVNEMYGRIDEVKIVRVRCEQDQREPRLWRATLSDRPGRRLRHPERKLSTLLPTMNTSRSRRRSSGCGRKSLPQTVALNPGRRSNSRRRFSL